MECLYFAFYCFMNVGKYSKLVEKHILREKCLLIVLYFDVITFSIFSTAFDRISPFLHSYQ